MKKRKEYPKNYCVVKIETTGLDRHDEITEIACIRCVDDKITDDWSTLVKTTTPITDEAMKLTGITDEMTAHGMSANEAISVLREYVGDDVIVTHRAGFEMQYINRYCKEYLGYKLSNKIIDTRDVAVLLYGEDNDYDDDYYAYKPCPVSTGLQALADRLDVGIKWYRALEDARLVQRVYVGLKAELEDEMQENDDWIEREDIEDKIEYHESEIERLRDKLNYHEERLAYYEKLYKNIGRY